MPNAFKKVINWFKKSKSKEYKEVLQRASNGDHKQSKSESDDDESETSDTIENIILRKKSVISQCDNRKQDELMSLILPKINNLSFIRLSDYSKTRTYDLAKMRGYSQPLWHQEDASKMNKLYEQYYENNNEMEDLLKKKQRNKVTVKKQSILQSR